MIETKPRADLAAATSEHFAALIEWAVNQRSAATLPPEVMRRAAIVLGDDLAAAIAARDEPQVRAAQGQQLAHPGPKEATVFRGGRPRTDRYRAAVANAIAMPWVELDEGYRRAIGHAGLYVIPALVAEAEATSLGVREVLVSLALAYEIASRMPCAYPFPPMRLHPHAARASIGAAAAIALARRKDAKVTLDAVAGATAIVHLGPYRHAIDGALARNVWSAAAAWHGMRAVDFADCGIAGLPSAPYEVFSEALGAEAKPELLSRGLGEDWAIADGYHKIYACCQYAHSAVESVLAIIGSRNGKHDPAAIERVIVETSDLGMSLANYAPATILAAKFSMPHCVAATLFYGEAGPKAFASETLADPGLADLRGRIELRERTPALAWPNDRPAKVTVHYRDGTSATHETLSARGGPDRPFSDDDLLAKIGRLTADVYPNFAMRFAELIAAKPGSFEQPWPNFVTELTGVQ